LNRPTYHKAVNSHSLSLLANISRYIHYRTNTIHYRSVQRRGSHKFRFRFVQEALLINHNRVLSLDGNICQQHRLPIIPKRFRSPITMTAVHLTPKPTSNKNIMSACPPPPKAADKFTQATTTISHLTPKPTKHDYILLTCPPPPKAAPKPIDLDSFPSLSLPSCFGAEGFILTAPAFIKPRSKNFPVKRSRDGRSAKSSLPSTKLKPRPSKYTESRRPTLHTSSRKTSLNSITRSASFQRAYLMNGDSREPKPKLPRHPSFSRAA